MITTYKYKLNDVNDNWIDAIYIDIETANNVSDFKDKNDLDTMLTYLNVKNARHCCYAVHVNYADKIDNNMFSYVKQIDDFVYYVVNNSNMNDIADKLLYLIDVTNLTTIIAHNGNRFDFLVLKDKIDLNEKYNVIIGKYKNKRLKFVDTINIAKTMGSISLNSFAQATIRKSKLYDANNIVEYLVHDVYLLVEIGKYLNKLGIAFTATRTARKGLYDFIKSRYDNVKSIDTFIHNHDFASFQYVGGRSQVFTYIADYVNVFDFNSLYPSVLAMLYFPRLQQRKDKFVINVYQSTTQDFVKDVNFVSNVLDELLNNFDYAFSSIINVYPLQKYYFAKVRIKGFNKRYEQYAHVIKRYNPFATSFLNQRIYTYIPNNEYYVYGYEIIFLPLFDFDVIDVVYANASLLEFKDFYIENYQLRRQYKNENNDLEKLVKIYMNASYGTFGLREHNTSGYRRFINFKEFYSIRLSLNARDYVIISKSDDGLYYYDVKNNAYNLIIKIADDVYLADTIKANKFSFSSSPTLALATTSNARFVLYSFILYLALNNFDVYYVDTDSLHTNAPVSFLSKYISNNMLSLKHEVTAKARYLAPKTYTLISDDKKIIKHKSIGNELERTIIMQSIRTDFKIIMRKFIDINNVPAYIPNSKYQAILNENKVKIADCSIYMDLVNEYIKLHSN